MTTKKQMECQVEINETKHEEQSELEVPENESSDYWIYLNSSLQGPYNVMQLIQMYKASQIRRFAKLSVQIAVNPATERWYSIELSENADNTEIANNLPYFYQNFVERIVDNKIGNYMPPDPPSNSKSIFQRVATVFTLFFDGIFRLHWIIVLPVECIYCLILIYKYNGVQNVMKLISGKHEQYHWHPIGFRVARISQLISHFGLLITPLCVVFVCLQYYEMHSMMIAYVAWGISSFSVLAAPNLIDIYWGDPKKEFQNRIVVSKYSFQMANIDVANVDIYRLVAKYFKRSDRKRLTSLFSAVFWTIPSMICVIVGATVGFIANYILEEKFLLKCGGDTVNDNLCFQSGYGCCNVISSHDFKSTGSFTFLSSMGGSIIAIYAIVKIMILLYAQGHSILYSMTAKSK